jgi:hypothetical protein
MSDPEYYYYYVSTVWGNQECVEGSHNDSPKYLFVDSIIAANNGRHVSFLSENVYSDINGTYSKSGPYNIYQIEREINILTKNLYQIMMEIKTCSVPGYYNKDGEYQSSSNGNNNCSIYRHLENTSHDLWGLISSYTQHVPTDRISKKTLCQQYHDLTNLVSNFNSILARIQTKGITTPPTPILTQVDNNRDLRVEIEKKLDNIYSNADSRELDSVRMLDSTVYTSVLWTVLATSVIFFMFKKM